MAKTNKKQEDNESAELNAVMSVYRDSVLPTPILLWRTEGKTVAALELTEEQYKKVKAALGNV